MCHAANQCVSIRFLVTGEVDKSDNLIIKD